MATLGKRAYAEMFGPTTGDRVRLADTDLVIEVEADHTLRAGGYGEEVKFGGGKTIRDGMGQSQAPNGPGAHEAVDCVITNALIVDHWGIVKADIGIRGQRILAIGKAGGAGGLGWSNTNEAKVISAAFLDAHNHLVDEVQRLVEKPLPEPVPTKKKAS